MPNIRVMVWNIRKFGQRSTQIPGMLPALSRIIRGADPDIVVILEVVRASGGAGMGALCTQLRADDPANHWRGMISYSTGAERYGFICRNLNLVRPLQATPTTNAIGTAQRPVRNIETLRFTTWPANFPAPVPAPPLPPFTEFPLVGLFYEDPGDRPGKKQRTFSGQSLRGGGGYNEGNGGRLPCLAVFHIRTPAPAANDCYLPILVNHYWASRRSNATNAGALSQISQSPLLHITQKFAHRDGFGHTVSGYLDIDGAAVALQELIFTGDWNVDFRLNDANGGVVARRNRAAFNKLTPAQQDGGSLPIPLAAPPAAFAWNDAGVVQGPGPADPAAAPGVPFNPVEEPSVDSWIPRQYLSAAVTTQGTILYQAAPPATYNANLALVNAAVNSWQLRPTAFDLVFFAGTRLNTAAVLTPAGATAPGLPADAGGVVDVPAGIRRPAGLPLAAGQFRVGLLQQYFANNAPNAPVRAANQAPNLNVAGAAPLTLQDRWLGAQMISDHVPVVLQFVVP